MHSPKSCPYLRQESVKLTKQNITPWSLFRKHVHIINSFIHIVMSILMKFVYFKGGSELKQGYPLYRNYLFRYLSLLLNQTCGKPGFKLENHSLIIPLLGGY